MKLSDTTYTQVFCVLAISVELNDEVITDRFN